MPQDVEDDRTKVLKSALLHNWSVFSWRLENSKTSNVPHRHFARAQKVRLFSF